jgi:hypothetical protein
MPLFDKRRVFARLISLVGHYGINLPEGNGKCIAIVKEVHLGIDEGRGDELFVPYAAKDRMVGQEHRSIIEGHSTIEPAVCIADICPHVNVEELTADDPTLAGVVTNPYRHPLSLVEQAEMFIGDPVSMQQRNICREIVSLEMLRLTLLQLCTRDHKVQTAYDGRKP